LAAVKKRAFPAVATRFSAAMDAWSPAHDGARRHTVDGS
jgi:hypothetical protein